jgi:hypothetical protein
MNESFGWVVNPKDLSISKIEECGVDFGGYNFVVDPDFSIRKAVLSVQGFSIFPTYEEAFNYQKQSISKCLLQIKDITSRLERIENPHSLSSFEKAGFYDRIKTGLNSLISNGEAARFLTLFERLLSDFSDNTLERKHLMLLITNCLIRSEQGE